MSLSKAIWKLTLSAGAFCALQAPAIAGTATGGVNNLVVRDSDGLVYVQLNVAPSGRPPCAAGTTYFMIPHENSDTGKKLYALLLSAKLAAQQVTIVGANTCNRWGDGEDILYVVIQ